MSEIYDKQPGEEVQPKSGAASDHGTTPVNSLNKQDVPDRAARGPEDSAETRNTAARLVALSESRPVVVVSGPETATVRDFAYQDAFWFGVFMTDADWGVHTAGRPGVDEAVSRGVQHAEGNSQRVGSKDQQVEPRAFVYFGRHAKLDDDTLRVIKSGRPVVFVRELHRSDAERRLKDMVEGGEGELDESIFESVKFADTVEEAGNHVMKMNARIREKRRSAAEGTPQAAAYRAVGASEPQVIVLKTNGLLSGAPDTKPDRASPVGRNHRVPQGPTKAPAPAREGPEGGPEKSLGLD